jgi:predicted DsbA family dithiol-disulfide isomerase
MIIDVWSDVVCPWCFIGRRRLQKAISTLPPDLEVTVIHRAFQLNPDAKGTVPTKELLAEKYQLPNLQVEQMQTQVCSVADGEGLYYDLSNTLSGNTMDAHRLLLWADSQDKQDDLLELMYSSYFEKNGSLFDHDSLLDLTDLAGLDRQTAKELLSADHFAENVEQDQQLAHQLGATGVPFYVVNMKHAISGAQPQEVFDQTLANALSDED